MGMMWKSIALFAAVLCCSSLAHGFSYSKATLLPHSFAGVSQFQPSMLLRVPGPRSALRQERSKIGRFLTMAIADIASTPTAASTAAVSSSVVVPSSAAVAVPAGVAAGAADSAAPVASTGTVGAGDIFNQVSAIERPEQYAWSLDFIEVISFLLVAHMLVA
jgi:hypothetical protein